MFSYIQNKIQLEVERRKISYRELARRSGFRNLARLVKAKSFNPHISTIYSISRGLECSISELLDPNSSLQVIRPDNLSNNVHAREKIKEKMKELNISRAKLRTKNISFTLCMTLDSDKFNPRLQTIYALAKVFNCSVEELLDPYFNKLMRTKTFLNKK